MVRVGSDHVEDQERVDRLVWAHGTYPSLESGSYYDEVLVQVQERASQSGSAGKVDIGALMLWKRLNLNTKWAAELNELSDQAVRAITKAAFELARDINVTIPEAARCARNQLLDLPGCKHRAAVASTLLTAGSPTRMAVYDTRAVRGLMLLGYPDPQGYYRRYMETVCELMELMNRARGLQWTPRDVDKALFMLGGEIDDDDDDVDDLDDVEQ